MIKVNNFDITNLYYSGYTIVRAYGCEGELVYGNEPVPPSTDKLTYVLNGTERTIQCNSSSTLTKVEIVSSTAYGERMSSITSVEIGECVNTIGNACFDGCTSLTSATIPNSVTSIDYQAFKNCHILSSVTIPSGVTAISDYLFDGDYDLANTNIPDGVTSIGIDSYFDCLSLMNITIPSSVTSIGQDAFRANYWTSSDADKYAKMMNMATGRTITILATTPPTLGLGAFGIITGQVDIARYPIYVPAESLNAYKTATNWSDYADRIFPIGGDDQD